MICQLEFDRALRNTRDYAREVFCFFFFFDKTNRRTVRL